MNWLEFNVEKLYMAYSCAVECVLFLCCWAWQSFEFSIHQRDGNLWQNIQCGTTMALLHLLCLTFQPLIKIQRIKPRCQKSQKIHCNNKWLKMHLPDSWHPFWVCRMNVSYLWFVSPFLWGLCNDDIHLALLNYPQRMATCRPFWFQCFFFESQYK